MTSPRSLERSSYRLWMKQDSMRVENAWNLRDIKIIKKSSWNINASGWTYSSTRLLIEVHVSMNMQYITVYCSIMCKSTCLPTARKKNTTQQNSKWINGWVGNLANPCNGWGEEHDKSKKSGVVDMLCEFHDEVEKLMASVLCCTVLCKLDMFLIIKAYVLGWWKHPTRDLRGIGRLWQFLFPVTVSSFALLLCLLFVSLGCSNRNNIYQHAPRPCLHLNE